MLCLRHPAAIYERQLFSAYTANHPRPSGALHLAGTFEETGLELLEVTQEAGAPDRGQDFCPLPNSRAFFAPA